MSTAGPSEAVGPPDIAAWPPPPAGPAVTYGPALLDWAADQDPDRPRVCLVKGARGSGKSTLLAWFLAGARAHPRTTVNAVILAEGLFTDPFAWELARQLGYGPLAPHRLLDRLAADGRPLLLLVADLHRSGRGPADRPPALPRTLVEDLVVPLLELPQTRALVEVGDSGLLDGWAEAGSAETVDLGGQASAPPAQAPAAQGDLTVRLPHTPDGRALWDEAADDVREHALDQALRGRRPEHAVLALLADPGFLLHGSPVSVAACLADDRVVAPPGLRQTWRLAAPHLADPEPPDAGNAAGRAAVLHTAALPHSPTLARYLLPLARNHVYTAAWMRPEAAVTAVAALPGEPGTLLAADPLGDLALLDAATGRNTAAVPSPGTARAYGVAVRRDRSLLLLTDTGALVPFGEDPAAEDLADGTDPAAEDPADSKDPAVLARIAAHHGRAALGDPGLRPSAIGQSPGGSAVVIGDEQGNVHVWPLGDPPDTPLTRPLHEAPVAAVTCLDLTGDSTDTPHTLVLSAGMDGAVRVWETSADPMPVPLEQRPAIVTALAAAQTGHGPVLAAAWNDGLLHLWHLATGRVRALPLLTPCSALALSADGRLVVCGTEGTYALTLDTGRLWP